MSDGITDAHRENLQPLSKEDKAKDLAGRIREHMFNYCLFTACVNELKDLGYTVDINVSSEKVRIYKEI